MFVQALVLESQLFTDVVARRDDVLYLPLEVLLRWRHHQFARHCLHLEAHWTTFVICQRSKTLATSYSLKPWHPAKALRRLTGNPVQPARTLPGRRLLI